MIQTLFHLKIGAGWLVTFEALGMGINFCSKSDSILVIDNENKTHLLAQSLLRLFDTGMAYFVHEC